MLFEQAAKGVIRQLAHPEITVVKTAAHLDVALIADPIESLSGRRAGFCPGQPSPEFVRT